ncbi:MAG: hypothetical protein IT190_08380 [Microbacteriaceae bacterium]|nr:hypothetical protein [Microbacteriaceae bacterium]
MTNPTESAAKERYGESSAGSPEEILRYLKSLKIIAAADGFSEEERASLQREIRRMSLPPDLFRAVDDFDARSAKLEDYLLPDTAQYSRRAMLLYDAIKLSHADGYSAAEQQATAHAAKLLGLSVSTLRSLEHLVRLEHEVRDLRHALMSGE